MDPVGVPLESPTQGRKGYTVQRLTADPWRLFFPLGFAAAATTLGLWVATLGGHGAWLTPGLHGVVMLWGALGSAVIGFLLTAYPRQNGAEPPHGALVLFLALAQIAGVLLAALQSLEGALISFGLASALCLLYTSPIAFRSLRRAWEPTTAAVPVSLLASIGALVWMNWDPRVGLELGLHGYLILLAVALLDRVLPFFSRKLPDYAGGRQRFLLPVLALLLLSRPLWLASPALMRGFDLMAALTLVLQLARLQAWRSWRQPLLLVLYLGLGWLAVGYLVHALGQPARHLWTVGGLSTLLVGFGTRVIRGHGGLELKLGWGGALAVGLVQVSALQRGLGWLGASWQWAGILLAAAFLWLTLRFSRQFLFARSS